jgi:hypothetical protein
LNSSARKIYLFDDAADAEESLIKEKNMINVVMTAIHVVLPQQIHHTA